MKTPSEVCKLKVKYLTRGNARVAGRKRSGTGLLYYYKCDICAFFHLTKLAEFNGKQHAACV